MELPALCPGEEYYYELIEKDGTEKVQYAFCSLRGEFFSCITKTKEEAQRFCEEWLLQQECRGCR